MENEKDKKSEKRAVARRTKVYKLKRRPRGGNSTETSTGNSTDKAESGGTADAIDEKTSTLASMEQQLRAGIRPTIPSSAEARATLARSLPDLRPATGVPRAVIRVVDMGPAPIPRKRKSYKRREKSDVLDGKKKAGVSRWVVATDWPFSEKALKGMAFAKEIWMMMTAFGDPRGAATCTCSKRGSERCPCLDAVCVMDDLVRSFGLRLVAICREWSSPKPFSVNHLQMAMPGEMREFMAWKAAHSKRGTKNVEEKRAGITLDDEDVDDDDDIDVEEAGSTADGDESINGEGTTAYDAGVPGDEEISGAAEDREMAAEEEEVARRMLHRKRFADDMTADMEDEDYVDMYFEHRKAFFIAARGSRRDAQPGSRGYFVNYLGLKGSREGKCRKLLDALAFILYDYVGLVVEIAIRRRNGGRLVLLPSGSMLTAEEVTVAASKLPRLPDREQRERVQAMRAAHPDGISKKALQEFPVGLTHRGDPLKWPCNTMHRGRVLVEGGELVNPSDSKLAEEAMAMLKEDFADFDA